jgi:hypothetical protein
MPSSRYLISSQTLGSAAASVTFSSIPATYTDLVLRMSGRSDSGSNQTDFYVTLNSDTASNYSTVTLRGEGNAAYSDIFSNITPLFRDTFIVGGNATASTFGSAEMYIPSYTVSQNKPISVMSVTENNIASTVRMVAGASLWRNNSAINSIKIETIGSNMVSGSSFYLYGIKNS